MAKKPVPSEAAAPKSAPAVPEESSEAAKKPVAKKTAAKKAPVKKAVGVEAEVATSAKKAPATAAAKAKPETAAPVASKKQGAAAGKKASAEKNAAEATAAAESPVTKEETPVTKEAPAKPAEAKKEAPKKEAAKKPAAKAAPTPAKKPAAKGKGSKAADDADEGGAMIETVSRPPARPAGRVAPASKVPAARVEAAASAPALKKSPYPKSFIAAQKQKLLDMKDLRLEEIDGISKELREHESGAEASGLGDHIGDAGNDASSRDFALSRQTMDLDGLREIDDALKRIENGRYGICEGSGEVIPEKRLEALPYSRYTVQYQAELEKNGGGRRIARSSRAFSTEEISLGESDESVDS